MFKRNRRRRYHTNENPSSGCTDRAQAPDNEIRENQGNILGNHREARQVNSLSCILHSHLDGDTQPRQRNAASEMRRIMSMYGNLTYNARPVSVANSQGFKDFVMYCAAYLCYNWRVDDSSIISKVLINMFKNCGHFMILFQKSLPHPIRDFGWIGPLALMNNYSYRQSRAQAKGTCPFSFFARHAHRAKLTFRWIRFVDLRLVHPNGFRPSPVYLSASLGEYELLRFLLQLGADLRERSCEHRGRKHAQQQQQHQHQQRQNNRPPWVVSLIDKLLSNALRNGVLSQQNSQHRSIDNGRSEILCLRLLLRAVPHLNIEWLEFRRNSYWKTIFDTAEEMVLSLSDKGLLPCFPQRCLEPSELKHLCRIAIRDRLRGNWELPEGIFRLDMPRSLEAYLNLEDD